MKQSIHALSIAPNVHGWLAEARDAHLLHIFDQACSLINERRDVVSIVTPQIGNGPFNVVVDEDICFSEQLELGSVVSFSSTELCLGDLIVHLSNARHWNPSPDWQTLHLRRADILRQLTKLPITNHLNSIGLDTPFAKTAQRYPSQALVSNLSSALVNADLFSTRTVTAQLAGLGSGLTPAGDDILMGAIYAAWIIHAPEVANALAQAIVDTAAPLTTSLSGAWLRAAGRGEAGILWHEFFEALLLSENMRIQRTIDKILAVGETSGADALAGFIAPWTTSSTDLIFSL